MHTESPGTVVFRGLPDLASAQLGGVALLASDEFFAGKEHLLFPGDPEWREGVYTDRGKWMDGWEPRRRRAPGHDWCIVRLGVPGDIFGVDINTRFFTGNHAPYASLSATIAPLDASPAYLRDEAEWTRVLEQVPLERDSHNVCALVPFEGATHVKLDIYPAGGVARLRVHGRPRPIPPRSGERVDLASVLRGGRALACSDAYFARMDNLVVPGPPPTMGDGWETKRSPLPKQDWVVVALGEAGLLDEIVVDTAHFKGNYPEAVRIDALYWPDAPPYALTKNTAWQEIVPPMRLGPDRAHSCTPSSSGPWTHLRLTILTDGGVARLRAYGAPSSRNDAEDDALLRFLNQAPVDDVRDALLRCCGSHRFVEGALRGRPYKSRTHLFGHIEELWWHLGEGDWREAFTHHPRIGADVAALRAKFASTSTWAEGEQAGVRSASEETLTQLAAGNEAYEARFGHLFIVCASGLSAEAMLSRLQSRLDNLPEVELRVAAAEQLAITRLRLDKLQVNP
ncbi:MAG: allantoicase [Myxococcota bacterium]